MGPSTLTINLVASGKPVTLTSSATSLSVKSDKNKVNNIPIRQVVQAHYQQDSQILQVSYVWRKKAKGPSSLVRLEGKVQGELTTASEWAESVTKAAYEDLGVKRHRRIKVLVNPFGGVGKGVAIFTTTVEPILRAAGCTLDVQHTNRGGHAYDIAKELPLSYDAIVSVSGDGLIHEIMNGFAHHEHPMKAFAIPIAPIPTGSGNGLALNLLGLADGFDVVLAALNVVKGFPMKIDVFSFVQNDTRTISFMSQAMGLMADLDIGTDNLRWMGDTRFVYGLLKGLIPFKPCPVEFSYKAAAKDKDTMAQEALERHKNDRIGATAPVSAEITEDNDAFPSLQLDHDFDEWTTFKEPLLYLYAGKGPYVARDFMAFPASLPDDGLIDIVAQVTSTRADILGDLTHGPQGVHFWKKSCSYIKAHAYRVKPLSPKGALAIDGEPFPFEPFYVEVHPKLATLLSPHGYYAAEFPQKPKV
ncbi:ATP-NAD kinase-like domain-containing protein [Mucidula mucida]|nr:ATP-NAD kinase-like domain-containing protein [Mucidula mucida]